MNVGRKPCARACRCGVRYERAELEALRPVRTLEHPEISEHALGWPEDMVVDVRECASCRSPIAVLRRTP